MSAIIFSGPQNGRFSPQIKSALSEYSASTVTFAEASVCGAAWKGLKTRRARYTVLNKGNLPSLEICGSQV